RLAAGDQENRGEDLGTHHHDQAQREDLELCRSRGHAPRDADCAGRSYAPLRFHGCQTKPRPISSPPKRPRWTGGSSPKPKLGPAEAEAARCGEGAQAGGAGIRARAEANARAQIEGAGRALDELGGPLAAAAASAVPAAVNAAAETELEPEPEPQAEPDPDPA